MNTNIKILYRIEKLTTLEAWRVAESRDEGRAWGRASRSYDTLEEATTKKEAREATEEINFLKRQGDWEAI